MAYIGGELEEENVGSGSRIGESTERARGGGGGRRMERKTKRRETARKEGSETES